MEITLKVMIDATPALLYVLNDMVGAMRGLSTPAQAPTKGQPATPAQDAPSTPTIPQPEPAVQAPTEAPKPDAVPDALAQTQAPVTPPPVVPGTSAAAPAAPGKTYTWEDLSPACTPLVDAGRIDEIRALLDQHGAKRLQDLTPEQCGAVATELRKMGARI